MEAGLSTGRVERLPKQQQADPTIRGCEYRQLNSIFVTGSTKTLHKILRNLRSHKSLTDPCNVIEICMLVDKLSCYILI